jgi:GGDEF domain-containing protein
VDIRRPDPPRRRRARPVADAPVDELLLRTEDLTKGWLLALLEQAPLDDAPGILAADVARDGPRVCDAIVRALADETDLRRLEEGGALELLVAQTGEFAGAQGVAATSRAVDALGAIMWSALRDSLRHPDPEQVTELAERLSLVMELVRAAALRRLDLPEASRTPQRPAATLRETAGPRHEPLPPRRQAPAPRHEALPAHEAGPAPPPQASAARAPHEVVDPDALWVGALEDEIARSERNGTPLSLLLVELEDADRVAIVEPSPRATATFGHFAQAVRSVLRRQDTLACESDSRAWIIARDTGRIGGQALGSRIVGAVRAAPPWRGAPLAVNVGLAVLGEDGRDRSSLVEAAEESCYDAEASGVGISGDPAPWREPPT